MSGTTMRCATYSELTTGSIWSRPYRFLTLGLILTIVAAAFEQLSVATTMPATVRDLGGLSLYGWVFSAFMLTMIVGLTVGGGDVDRIGPLRPFLSGVALFALGLVVAGLASTMLILIAGRVIQGFGAGLLASVIYAVIGRSYPEATRPRMLALISSAYTIPSLIGPAFAGLVADYLGWRWIFLGLAPVMPLAAVLAVPAMQRFDRVNAAPRDRRRIGAALRVTAGVAILTSALGSDQSILVTAGLVAIGMVLAVSAVRHLLPAETRQAVGLPSALLTAILLNMAFFGIDAFVPLALTIVRGQTASFAGLAITAATISWVTSAWIQSQLAPRQSRRVLVSAGLILIIIGLGCMIAVLQNDVPLWLALVAWGIAGLGMGFASPTLTLLSMELAPLEQQGASTSAMGLAGILGIALGTGIGGVIVGNTHAGTGVSLANVTNHSLLMIGLLVIALWIAYRLPGRTQNMQKSEQTVGSH